MPKIFTDEFLISELERFVSEEGFVPTQECMKSKLGYPSSSSYKSHFKTWNNALEIANFEVNKKHQIGILDGTEVCSYCHKRADEIPNFKSWLYHDGVRYCSKHGKSGKGGKPHYVVGNLDINSPKGLGRAGEILVVKALKIGNEFDCNRESCHSSIDMYNEEYGKIDVKTGLFNYQYNRWNFTFNAKKVAKTYICLGMSFDRSSIEHIWIVSNEGEIRNLTTFTIKNTRRSLLNRNKWEVDLKQYDETWREMIINYQNDECKIFR